MTELGEFLTGTSQSKQDIKHRYGKKDETTPVFKYTQELLKIKGGPTAVDVRANMDSFVIGHTINGLIGMGQLLDSMEVVGNWAVGGSFNARAADNTHIKELLNSIKVDWKSQAEGTLTDAVTNHGNLAAFTGVNNGTPSQGTVGAWVWVGDRDYFSGGYDAQFTLRFGSGVADYAEYSSINFYDRFKNDIYGWIAEADYSVADGGVVVRSYDNMYDNWNYLLFDLDDPDSVTGVPDWTATDYIQFRATTANAAGSFWVDYVTISGSDYIALNGIGDRTETHEDFRVANTDYAFVETFMTNDYENTGVTTANWDTVNHQITFAANQIAQTSPIYTNDGRNPVTDVMPQLTTTGSLTLEVSANNGTNWETVTNNSKNTLSYPGHVLLFKATEDAAGAATITSPMKITYWVSD